MNKFEKELINKLIYDIAEGKIEEMREHYNELLYLKELYDESKEENNNGNI